MGLVSRISFTITSLLLNPSATLMHGLQPLAALNLAKCSETQK
jgi:hypothetical protein